MIPSEPSQDKPRTEVHDALPPEVAIILIIIGIIAVPLPGPGIPFIVAGGLVLWPATFRPIDRKIQSRFPDAHTTVHDILDRFESDLNRRYPKGK
ncbi:MAG: hypothetical protein RJA81_136 [Planctomycetota bacterium]